MLGIFQMKSITILRDIKFNIQELKIILKIFIMIGQVFKRNVHRYVAFTAHKALLMVLFLVQIRKINFQTSDLAYSTFTTYSNIECYNKCLNDINCVFVEKHYTINNNCLLKSIFNTSNQQLLDNGSEAFLIESTKTYLF